MCGLNASPARAGATPNRSANLWRIQSVTFASLRWAAGGCTHPTTERPGIGSRHGEAYCQVLSGLVKTQVRSDHRVARKSNHCRNHPRRIVEIAGRPRLVRPGFRWRILSPAKPRPADAHDE